MLLHPFRMGESFLVPLTSAGRPAARTISCSGSSLRSSGVWPLRILSAVTQSFLLVVCTGWIVTRVEYHRILQMFQHIARCASYHCWQEGLAMNLRTVIVTAAVYWGFPSKRRLAANSSG